MNLESQLTSLDLSKKLFELCVKQQSVFYWSPLTGKYYLSADLKDMDGQYFDLHLKSVQKTIPEKVYSAFSVAELGDILKDHPIFSNYADEKWHMFSSTGERLAESTSDTEADCRGKTLVYLIEQGLIKND